MLSIEGAIYCVNIFRNVQQGQAEKIANPSNFRDLFESLIAEFHECRDTDALTLHTYAEERFNGDEGAAKSAMRRGVPLFNLAVPKEESEGRTLSHYKGHSSTIIFDIDSATERGFAALIERLKELGWTHFYYPSHSCGSPQQRLHQWKTETGQHGVPPGDGPVGEGPAVRYRVLIELDRGLQAADHGRNEYAQLHSAMVGFVSAYEEGRSREGKLAEEGCLVDPCSKKMAQIYYVPAGASWKRQEMRGSFFEGAPAEVDMILAEFQQQEPEQAERLTYPEICASVDYDRIKDHRKSFKKVASAYLKETLQMIKDAPRHRGVSMYSLKNDRSFAIGGFAASGALEAPAIPGRPKSQHKEGPEGVLDALKEAHRRRLSQWADDLIDPTYETVEKAFVDGAQKPLFESHMKVMGLEAYERDLVLDGDDIPEIAPPLPTIANGAEMKLFVDKPHITARHFYAWMQSDDNRGDGRMRFGGEGVWYRIKPEHGDSYWRKIHSVVGNSHAHMTAGDEEMYARFCRKIGQRIPAFRAFIIAKAFKAARDSCQEPNIGDIQTYIEAMPMLEWDADEAVGKLLGHSSEVFRALMAIAPMHQADPEQTWHKIPVQNGVLNLQTLKLEKGEPEDYLTGGLDAVAFDPNASCPRFLQYLKDVQPDPEMQKFVIRLMGYNLLNSNPLQKVFMHIGRGANGKSAWKDITANLMGDGLVGSPPSEVLTAEKNDSHPELYGQLEGLRVGFLSETSNGAAIDENTLKQLTGEKKLRMRRMRQNYSEIPITFKLHVLTNNLPAVYSDNHGTWRRIVVVPWTEKIAEEKQDPFLAQNIQREEGDGVFGLAAEAAHQIILDLHAGKDPLRPPAACRAATQEYRTKYDRAQAFLDWASLKGELFGLGEDRVSRSVMLDDPETLRAFRIPLTELWDTYQRYTRRVVDDYTANPYLSSAQLTNALEEAGYEVSGQSLVGLCSAETYRKISRDPGGVGLN